MQWLLHQGADANCPNQGGSTPLHSAVSHGQSTAAELLVYKGRADPHAEDECGDSPLSLALSLGHRAVASHLALAHKVI